MSGKIVVLGPERYRNDMLRIASEQGIDMHWVDPAQGPDEIAEQCKDAVAMIPLTPEVSLDLVRRCPHLKLVQSISAGTDGWDLAAIAEMGVVTANNGGGNSAAVAEHAIALMVGVYRNIRAQIEATRAGKWQADVAPILLPRTHELTEKTVGIIGAGRIGRQVLKRLQGWDCTLIYHDIVEVPPDLASRLSLERVSLDDLLGTADVVTLHVPLTRRTCGMIGERELGLLKPAAILINTCRGAVIDEAALIDALRSAKIAGAGLDVIAREPDTAGNPLLDMDNVMVTPHLAGLSLDALHKSETFALRNAARVAAGGEPLSVVLPE